MTKVVSVTYLIFILAMTAVSQETPAKLISAPKFEISAEDAAVGIEGTMKIAVDVNDEGEVKKAIVYVGPSWPCSQKLDDRAIKVIEQAGEAARKWKFSPATKDGKPVDSWLGMTITIDNPTSAKAEPSSAASKPKMVVGGVLNGKALELARPAYPAEAKAARAGGAVSVQVLIDEQGKIIRAQAVSGHGLLQFAARAAACESKFSPTLLAGNPVKVSGVITYNFVP